MFYHIKEKSEAFSKKFETISNALTDKYDSIETQLTDLVDGMEDISTRFNSANMKSSNGPGRKNVSQVRKNQSDTNFSYIITDLHAKII